MIIYIKRIAAKNVAIKYFNNRTIVLNIFYDVGHS